MNSKIYYIIWKDVVSEDQWMTFDEIEPHYHTIESVGILVKESDEVITISPAHDLSVNNFCCILHIPKCMVISMKEVKIIQEN